MTLRSDRDIVMKAVSQNARALEHAADELRPRVTEMTLLLWGSEGPMGPETPENSKQQKGDEKFTLGVERRSNEKVTKTGKSDFLVTFG